MAHGDFSASEQKLMKRYTLTNQNGVDSLLTDIHHLREKRFAGTDTTFLSCLLIDFENVLLKAGLTPRQWEALYYTYEEDLTQEGTAKAMGISQQAVSKQLNGAISKIVEVAKEEELLHERIV